MIISVRGNEGVGKTTLSMLLANKLAKEKNNVIVIFLNDKIPTISYVLNNNSIKNENLVNILAEPQLEQHKVKENLIILNNNYIGYLGFNINNLSYENFFDLKNLRTFVEILKNMSDYVIIDTYNNKISDFFIKESDKIIDIYNNDLKSYIYYLKNEIDLKSIKILNNNKKLEFKIEQLLNFNFDFEIKFYDDILNSYNDINYYDFKFNKKMEKDFELLKNKIII